MKKTWKSVACLSAALLLVLSAACTSRLVLSTPEGSLEEILDRLYETVEIDEGMKGWLREGLATEPITAEKAEYFLGIPLPDSVVEGIASEPVMSGSAFSVCLLRVKDGTDTEALAKQIRNNVNTFKWVCVGVEKENVRTLCAGNVILLAVTEDSKAFVKAFRALAQ
ncbi:MAG: hypothetical protein IKD06_04435 [Clostridia bacterium]|nr:hypothetical protein [Clostridia bacterium]